MHGAGVFLLIGASLYLEGPVWIYMDHTARVMHACLSSLIGKSLNYCSLICKNVTFSL